MEHFLKSGCDVFPLSSSAMENISYEDLQVLLKENQNLVLVDVRSKGEVDNGHIPGSINIPRKSCVVDI